MEKQINITVTPQVLIPQTEESPIMVILDDIKEKLGEITELKYIDLDWGQLDDYSPNFPVKWPCALLDVDSAQYSNIGKDVGLVPANRQIADVTITVTIASLKLSNSNRKAPESQKQDANNIFNIIQQLHGLLHGYAPGTKAARLIRQSMQRIRRDDGVQQYKMMYATALHNV